MSESPLNNLSQRPLSRRTMLRYSALGAVAVAGGSVLTACGGGEEEAEGIQARIDAGNQIRLAIANEPPYTKLTKDGTLTGAAPDVAKAVLSKLGVDNDQVKGVQTAYDSMIPGLNAGRWEMVTAGLFMNESRCAKVAYSSPVIVSTESLALPPDNPGDLATLDDVKSKDVKVAVLAGSFELKTAKSLGIPESKLKTFPRAPDALQGMEAGRVQAILLPTLTLNALKKQQNAKFSVTPPLEAFPKTGSGAAFNPDDKAFVKKYDEQLKKFKQTDEFDSILDKWGFSGDAARSASTEELCKNPG